VEAAQNLRRDALAVVPHPQHYLIGRYAQGNVRLGSGCSAGPIRSLAGPRERTHVANPRCPGLESQESEVHVHDGNWCPTRGRESCCDLSSEIHNLAERVNRLLETIAKRAYENFESHGRIFGRELEDRFKAETELLHPVHLEMKASGEELEVKAEVPGFNEKEIQVSVEPDRLTITGERKTDKEEKKGTTAYAESW
jgi:HSP20 family molecular chaperone IbpA